MLSRIAIARRAPRVFAAPIRLYTNDGSVAQSKGFRYAASRVFPTSPLTLASLNLSKKEKAHEGMLIQKSPICLSQRQPL